VIVSVADLDDEERTLAPLALGVVVPAGADDVWELRRRLARTYILEYIQRVTQRAKLFQNGGSQAVRLPQSCRFPEDLTEVVVRREGNRIILEPVDEWSDDFRALVGAWTEDIPRSSPAKTPKRDPFE
jgi:antitoxin VapB